MSEKRKYRIFAADHTAEIVLAGLEGGRTVRDMTFVLGSRHALQI